MALWHWSWTSNEICQTLRPPLYFLMLAKRSPPSKRLERALPQYWSLQCMSNATLVVINVLLFWGHTTKMYYAKCLPFVVKASPRTAHHKIQWLQFVIRNIVGLQSWHSSIHFQIPITPATSTVQLRLGTNCSFGLAITTVCERGFFQT